MSSSQLETLKQQAATLSDEERREFVQFLSRAGIPGQDSDVPTAGDGTETKQQQHRQHLEWLKAHREDYAGRYVALAGQQLVGQGKSLREAREQALQHGIKNPFLVRVSSEQEVLPAGF